jgi:hypothetical protein
MALALAATAPALSTTDVTRAADKLAVNARPEHVAGELLRCGADLMEARRVVEALQALRDAA